MPKGSPFGENLRALVIYLRFTQRIAFERLATLLSDILGLEISEGALGNMLDGSRDASPRTQRDPLQTAFRDRSAIGRNRAAGRQKQLVAVGVSSRRQAVFVAEPSRAKKVVEDFLGDFRPDYLVSDRYGV